MSPLPVLVVEHEALCPPGWLGEWLSELGCTLDVRRPYVGEALPADLTAHRGMVVLGGSMDATSEQHLWLHHVQRLVRGGAVGRVPVLGVCLGHQLAALALGGAVRRNPAGRQMGLLEVGWTGSASDDPLVGGVAGTRLGVQWNNDIVVDVPPDAEVLAQTPGGEIQAARFAPTVWGVQWHPEGGAEMVRVWVESDHPPDGDRRLEVEGHLAAMADAREDLRAAWQPLAERFASLTREAAARW